MKRFLILLKIVFTMLFLVCYIAFGITNDIVDASVHKSFDWEKKVIYFDITKIINENEFRSSGLNMASKVIANINDLKDALIRESLFEIVMDSDNTLREYFNLNPDLILHFTGSNSILKRSYIKYSYDLKSLTVRYKLNLFPDFMNLFVSYEKPYDAFYPLIDIDIDKIDYTGIIIYAGEDYNDLSGVKRLKDSFFIKIYDENIKLYFDKSMVFPESLKRWGMLEYSNDVFYNNKDRIGVNPIKLVAKNIYGKNNTDIILDEYSIARLFSNSNNVRLLKEGKLVIIK